MAIVTINDEYLTQIGNAIRAKNGATDTYKPKEMAAAITAIPSGDVNYEITAETTYVIPYALSKLVSRCLALDPYTGESESGITLTKVTWNRSTYVPGQSLTTIEAEAFYGQYALSIIDLPDSVTTIERYAFDQLKGLKTLILRGARTPADYGYTSYSTSPFYATYQETIGGALVGKFFDIYVPASVYDAWSAFYPGGYIHKIEGSVYDE